MITKNVIFILKIQFVKNKFKNLENTKELIYEKDFQKLQNTIENDFVNNNATIEGVAENLASYYLLHGDINLITLLMGAQGKGLQVQKHNGEWIDAIAESDELVINVGDMLSRHTNNKLKSTIHQVVNPPRELWGTSRYSIPFFMHPISDMKLDCLENCIDDEHPKQFEDTTAGAYLYERLVDLGLIKK